MNSKVPSSYSSEPVVYCGSNLLQVASFLVHTAGLESLGIVRDLKVQLNLRWDTGAGKKGRAELCAWIEDEFVRTGGILKCSWTF